MASPNARLLLSFDDAVINADGLANDHANNTSNQESEGASNGTGTSVRASSDISNETLTLASTSSEHEAASSTHASTGTNDEGPSPSEHGAGSSAQASTGTSNEGPSSTERGTKKRKKPVHAVIPRVKAIRNSTPRVRRSTRLVQPITRYNVMSMKCPTCHRIFHEQTENAFYDDFFVCSSECWRKAILN